MRKHQVATIVNFCTNEDRFIALCLKEALRFSRQVIVSVSDHFFDGTKENRGRLDEIGAAFPECLFVEYPFVPKRIPRTLLKKGDGTRFWHNVSRLVGFSFLRPEIETVFFLDADEIADGERVQEWLESSDYHQHVTLKMANYWYFRESRYQAESWEDSIVLAQKRALNADLLLSRDERQAIYDCLPNPKRGMVTGIDGAPLFHHYSWVRTKEEMLKKVQTWGHRGERNWEKFVEEEFQKPFTGIDFVHGYRFKTVEPTHPIDMGPVSFPSRGKGKRKILEEADLLKIVKQARSGKSLFFRLF